MMDFNTPQNVAVGHRVNKANWSGGAGVKTAEKASSPVLSESKKHRRPARFSAKAILRGVFFIIATCLVVVATRRVYHHVAYAGIDTARYQAVYLTNDNVYFGKVNVQLSGDLFLTDVFRVQAATNTKDSDTANSASTSTQSATGDIRLIKPGKELHAPDDTMLIKRNNVLFIENLQTDGTVTKAIVDYHKQR